MRVGWNFHRRIDDYGTVNYFSHVTVDWFDQYKDYLKLGMEPLIGASKKNQDWNELRELKNSGDAKTHQLEQLIDKLKSPLFN